MELLNLKADIRTKTGKGHSRSLRRGGSIPAVLYGPKAEPLSLSVNIEDLEQLFKSNSQAQLVVNLDIVEGSSKRMAILKELQTNPLSKAYIHADFYEVTMDQKIKAKVPVRIKGKSKGVELGGMLQVVRREIEILCLPMAIPEFIEIDISDLDIGDSVHVKDIAGEGKFELPGDTNFTVVTVLTPKKEEKVEEEEIEEGAEEDGAEEDEEAAASKE